MSEISAGIAFLAGIASFLSPCFLPLLPAYLAFLTGTAVHGHVGEHRRRALQQTLLFIAGFTVVFIVIGFSLAGLARLVPARTLRTAGGVLILLFGFQMTGLFRLPFMQAEHRFFSMEGRHGRLGAFFLGMAFAAGWSPCVGQKLGAILVYAGAQDTMLQGGFLLLLYSAGLGVPLLLAALLVSHVDRFLRRIRPWLRTIEIASGLMLVALGLLMLGNQLGRLAALMSFLPTF